MSSSVLSNGGISPRPYCFHQDFVHELDGSLNLLLFLGPLWGIFYQEEYTGQGKNCLSEASMVESKVLAIVYNETWKSRGSDRKNTGEGN